MIGGGSFVTGYAVLAGVLGGCAAAAWLLCRARLAGLTGAARAVALAIVFEALLLAVHLVPAALSVLDRWTVLAATALAVLAAARVPRAPALADPPQRAAPPSPRWSVGLAAGAWCLVLAYLAVYLHGHHAAAVGHVDLLTFHLPDVARWMQDGTIWRNDQFVPLFSNGNYPQHGDVSFLAVMLPFEQDALIRLVPYPYLVATGVAVHALGRELRAPTSTAALLAAVAVATPVVLRPATVATLPDAVLLLGFAAGVLFLLRHARTGRTSELVLAAVALGIAFGTKWYGVSTVAIVLALWAGARLLARHRPAVVVRDGLLAGAITLAVGGIWLVRNWVVTGNPLFPVRVPGVFDAPHDVIRERYGSTAFDYMLQASAWSEHLLPAWWSALSLAGVLALAGMFVARRGRARVVALAVPVILAAYVITPYTALGEEGEPLLIAQNSRYLVPALLLGAALVAVAVGRLRGARAVVEGAAFGVVVVALLSVEPVPTARFAAAALAFAGLAALQTRGPSPILQAVRTRAQLPGRTLYLRVAAVGAVVIAGAVVTHEVQQRHAPARYASIDPPLRWLTEVAPEGARVGLAGTWDSGGASPVYPSFGPRLGNEVEYVGPFVDGLLRRHAERERFVEELGRYDVLVVGRYGRPAERRWARHAGWTVAVADRRLEVMLPPGSALAKRGRAAVPPAAPAPPEG